MRKNESKKLPLILFLISLSLHLFVFVASSHEYVWRERPKESRPIKFRVVSVEKPEEKLPPNPQSRFLSNANRKESGSGKPSNTPRLRREDRDLIPSRKGGIGPETASLSPVPEARVPALSVPPARPPTSPAVVKPKPALEWEEKKQEKKSPETSEITETSQSTETARLASAPKPSAKAPSPAIQKKIKPKAKPPADEKPEKKKIEPKAVSSQKLAPKQVVKKKTINQVVKEKPRKKKKKVEAKKKMKEKVELAALKPAPKPSAKAPSPAIQEKIKPKAKPPADIKPEKKKIETKTLPKKKPEPKPVVKKKAVKKVVEKKPRKENRKVEAKKQTKEKVELAALKPVTRSIQPRRPAPKQPPPKDPLALFRVKPRPRVKPKLPKFDLSDEAADRIAKRSLSDKDLEKEEGETISLDTRDFRYASYFAHIKRKIQNAWIWPVAAQRNRGELLLRFKLRKDGTLEEVRLIKSAGVRVLDDLAMAAVTKAAPFEPFPEGLERKPITATFVYE